MTLNDSSAPISDIVAWRRHLHTIPELLYEVHETAAFVAGKLAEFGFDEVATGVGRTGVVGVLHGRSGPGARSIGLRADMDALPITEESGVAYASQRPGAMHACGHDGHTAMLLGAARSLATTRDFDGTIVFIFQPAEEGGAGAKAMLEDGLLERFPVERVYGMHNLPGLPVGAFAIRSGATMASTDEFAVRLTGRGGHAALPHRAFDPILAGAALVQALQQVVSRNTDPLEAGVLSVTQFHSGFVHNVIPDTAEIGGTVRTLSPAVRELAERRIREIAAGIAAAHGVEAQVDYHRNYPVTVNAPEEAAFCARIAGEIAGAEQVNQSMPPLMAGEDFSYMLEERPGAFIFVGNGDSAPLHNAAYDFTDEAITHGVDYWTKLARAALQRN